MSIPPLYYILRRFANETQAIFPPAGIHYYMSFFDDISYRTLLGRAVGYSVVLFGGEAAYAEGIRRIVGVGPDKIEMAVGKKLLVIEGGGLTIDELEGGSVIVKGRITGVYER